MSGGVALDICSNGENLDVVWERLVKEEGLCATDWRAIFSEDFFDKVLCVDWSTPQSTQKLRDHQLPHGENIEAAELMIEFLS